MQRFLFRSSSIMKQLFKNNKNLNVLKFVPILLQMKTVFNFSGSTDLEDVEKKYTDYFSETNQEEGQGKLILNPKTKRTSKFFRV
jgi:hypothetical protein